MKDQTKRIIGFADKIKTKSESHKRLITRSVELFADCCGNLKLTAISEAHIIKYANKLYKLQYHTNTVNLYLRWLLYVLNKAKLPNIEAIKEAVKEKKSKEKTCIHGYLTEIQVKTFEAYAKESIYKSVFMFAYYTGMRYSDILAIRPNNICDDKLFFNAKKTDKNQIIPLNKKALALFEQIKKEVKKLPKQTTSINRFLAKEFGKLNILAVAEDGTQRPPTIHTARHTFATTLLTKGVEIYTVQRLLGHTNIKTTQRYAVVVDELKVKAVELL